MNSGSRSLHFVRLIFAALAVVLAAAGARAAPPFVMDGRYHDLAQLRIAEDEQGTITALDLLFYLDMTRNSLAASDLDLWLAPEEEREEDVWTDIAAATREFLAMRALGRRSGPVSAPDFVKEALLFSAAEAAWIETTIRQEIVVEPADIDRFYIANPGRYIGKARAQIRYIFLALPEDADVSVQREAENRLGALRDGIVRGETTFEQAAIQNSAAPSARAGGLIPEFERGTYFPELELQAFRLARPGQLSPVFVGNEGVYLVQLISKTEETKKPLKEVEAEIRKRLEQTHVGPYYRLHYGRLKANDFHQNFFAIWQYADLGAPVAIAAGRKLTRDEMIRINPGVVNANYEINWNVLGFEVENWLEGVTILDDLKKRGLDRHPLIERAEPIADQVIAAVAALGKSVDPASVTTVEAARATLARGAGAPEGNQGGLPQSRVVRISLAIDPAAVAQAGREDILREEVRGISRSIQRGEIPTTPSPLPFASQWASLAGKSDEEVEEKLNEARGAVRASGFAGVVFIIEFMGWHERLPGLSPHPALARLEPGRVARATTLGGGIEHFYVIESRFSTDSPWLEVPLALESAAFDTIRLAVFRAEVKNAEKTGRLLFTVPEKKEAEDEDSEGAGETAAEIGAAPMRVLLLGSGGREHAIAWKLRQSPRLSALFAAPGNPGIASLAQILPVNLSPPFSDLISACRREKIDLVAVGPEEPLAQGVADRLNEAGIKVFGPSAEGARLEASKSFAKEIMRSAGIPTARAEIFSSAAAAEAYLAAHDGPCVIKADGLAAGKGVTVAATREEAVRAVREALVDCRFGAAGASVLVEEFLEGTEASLLAFTDGRAVRAMESAQDYKRALDGDLGPNTGGMGAISPAPALTPEMRERAIREVLEPAVAELRRRGIDYRGVLYAGLMICKDGPKTIEFNCRFGDPETQAILPRLESDLLEIMLACVERRLASADLRWRSETSVCVVAASEGYPGDTPKGRVITGADPEPYSEISAASPAAPLVFHAGTARDADGHLITSGGRVFGVTALGADSESARAAAYARLASIRFGGIRFRRDIAARK